MKIELLELLCCPKTGQRLSLENGGTGTQKVEDDCSQSNLYFKVVLKMGVLQGHLVGRGIKQV